MRFENSGINSEFNLWGYILLKVLINKSKRL